MSCKGAGRAVRAPSLTGMTTAYAREGPHDLEVAAVRHWPPPGPRATACGPGHHTVAVGAMADLGPPLTFLAMSDNNAQVGRPGPADPDPRGTTHVRAGTGRGGRPPVHHGQVRARGAAPRSNGCRSSSSMTTSPLTVIGWSPHPRGRGGTSPRCALSCAAGRGDTRLADYGVAGSPAEPVARCCFSTGTGRVVRQHCPCGSSSHRRPRPDRGCGARQGWRRARGRSSARVRSR
jgi:hypothetical protein